MHRITALSALGVAAIAVWAALPEPAQTIPLDLSDARPAAYLSVGGRTPVRVIFDSGAGGNVVGRQFARTLGLPVRGSTDAGNPGASTPLPGFFTSIAPAQLGGANIEAGDAVAVELPAPLDDYAAVISPNAFSGRLVRFDFASSRAMVMAKTSMNTPSSPGHAYGGESGHPLPVEEVNLAGVTVVALLDSGSRYGLQLPVELARKIPLKGALRPSCPVRMLGGEHAAYLAEIDGAVRIGPLVVTDPTVQFVEGVPFANVGLLILKDATLVLDPEAQLSWLLPAAHHLI
ncbi:MAG: pepsin/retropepsin-like aspartic protease family protein [Steroidobacteraceae bacterium]